MLESEKQIEESTFLRESIGLFGQAITTLVAYLTLEDEKIEEDQFIKMQKQIDDSLNEIRQKSNAV